MTTVNYNGSQAYTITPNATYHIVDVLMDSVSQGAISSFTFNNVTANHTISASFAINTYTITTSAGANGAISPSGAVSVNHGANQSFTITPDANYHIADVLVDGVSQGAVGSYTFMSVVANHTISATFAIDTYTVTYDANGGTGATIATDAITLNNTVGGDSISLTKVANFSDKNVGTGKTVDLLSSTLGGTDASNYSLSFAGATGVAVAGRTPRRGR